MEDFWIALFQLNYNYVLISTHLSKEEEVEFRHTLERLGMIEKIEVRGAIKGCVQVLYKHVQEGGGGYHQQCL